MLMFLGYALGFWYGGKLIKDETINTNSGKKYDGN